VQPAIHVVAVPQPAVAAGVTIPVSGSSEWVPRSLVFTLACDANAGNRYVTVTYQIGAAAVLCVNAAALLLVANDTFRFAFSSRRAVAEWNTGTDILAPLEPMRLGDECSIVVGVSGAKAGDQLSGIVLAVEQYDLGRYGEAGYEREALAAPLA
jgi:hypothetical protein